MNKQNIRFMYMTSDNLNSDLSVIVEEIDNLLETSKYIELSNPNVFLHGKISDIDKEILIGREVIGREEDFYHHDEIKIKDFNNLELTSHKAQVSSMQELFKLMKAEKQYDSFRVEMDTDSYQSFTLYFF